MSERSTDPEHVGGTETLDAVAQRRAVRERYRRIATDVDEAGASGGDCCETDADCCGEDPDDGSTAGAKGYTAADLAAVPEGANLDLGCGNPQAFADMTAGETVLDLGAGAGFDCFLAAREVGHEGHVIGVDMTPAMVEAARDNAAEHDADAVEFRLGEIEHLPIADETVDVAISNCVVNLSPDKPQIFREAHRVLRPGGRLAISDVVKTADLPVAHRGDPDSVTACIAGASTVDDLETMLANAGFVDVRIEPTADSAAFISEWDDERDLSDYVVSATIEGRKPTA